MAVFADLPVELRVQIWEFCVIPPDPAVFVWGTGANGRADCKDVPFPRVRKRRYPLVTNTCRESRAFLLSPPVADRYYIGQDHRPLDPEIDTVFLRWPTHMRRMRMVTNLAIKYGNPWPWPAQVARIALSQECADPHNNVMPGTQILLTELERGLLLETLLSHHGPFRALKEVSLVCVDSDVDLDAPDPSVDLAEWTPAKTTMQERETVLALRTLLAHELERADLMWACRPQRLLHSAWGGSRMDRTAISVKRLVKPGVVRERSWWKGNALKMKVVGLARWWISARQS